MRLPGFNIPEFAADPIDARRIVSRSVEPVAQAQKSLTSVLARANNGGQ